MNIPSLSVVMPAYNEEALMARAATEIKTFVFSTVPDAELIVVNDGSTDKTSSILEEMSKEEARIVSIRTPHIGHGPAILAGLSKARGERILLLDSDCQIPLDGFQALWEKAKTVDGLLGIRSHRSDPWVRIFITTVLRHAIWLIFHYHLYDSNCAFKIFRQEYWHKMQADIPRDSLTPSIYIAISLKRYGATLMECSVPYRQRPVGEAKLRPGHLLSFCSKAFKQLLLFRKVVQP